MSIITRQTRAQRQKINNSRFAQGGNLRRIRLVQLLGILLFVIYLGLFLVDLFVGFLGEWQVIVLSVVLAIVSLNLIAKGVLLKSQSTLWFAITLLLSAMIIVVFDLNKVGIEEYYFVFSIIPIISSLINLAIFKNLIYIKVVVINLSVLIPILIEYVFELFYVWIILITVASTFVGIMTCRLWNLDKENE